MSSSIQYPYALDENNNLVFIEDLDVEHRHDHQFYCPNCGHEMRPRLGEHNVWHFAHSENQKCGVESYIHIIAKKILVKRFNDRSRPFMIKLWTHLICKGKETCKYFSIRHCEDSVLKEYDLHRVYDLDALEEVRLKYSISTVFQPDVLIRSSKTEHYPIYLEVFHKHRSCQKKLESGQHIIEIRIKDLKELNELDTLEIKQSERITFYNFKDIKVTPKRLIEKTDNLHQGAYSDWDPLLPVCLRSKEGQRKYQDYQRIVLYPSGKTYFSGIFQDEMGNHKSSALADITYNMPRIPESFNVLALLMERIPKNTRTCLMCNHCAMDFDESNKWCNLGKNGSKRQGTFNEKNGSNCSFFETGIRDNPQNNLIEGVDYTIWINPKHE